MADISYLEYPAKPVVIGNLSALFMKQSRFVPLQMEGDTLRIAMADPGDFYTIDTLKLACNLNIEVCHGREDEILAAI
jgi:hypothetical protein